MNKSDEKGFSLVGVMIAVGLVGGLSMVLMQIMKQMSDGQAMMQSTADMSELKNEINMILQDKRHCGASLAENGNPIKFDKVDIDEPDVAGEGIEVELFYGHYDYENNPRVRTKKKFAANDSYGSVKVQSIKLFMPNSDPSAPKTNYPVSNYHTDLGFLRVLATKKTYGSKDRDVQFDFPLVLAMKTDTSGTTVLSCAQESTGLIDDYGYPSSSCEMTFSHRDGTDPWRSATLNLGSGGFVRLKLSGDVNSDDQIRIASTCPTGNKLNDYLRSCTLYFGLRDGTDADTQPATPAVFIAHNIGASTDTLSLIGDVLEDDTFYHRMTCPIGADPDLDAYVKNKCMFCFGQTDGFDQAPSYTCKKVQGLGGTYEKLLMTGDVDYSDHFFFGFFCGESPYPVIQDYAY